MRAVDMETIRGGISVMRIKFSDFARAVFETAIDHRRAEIKLPPDASRGVRFNDDTSVLVRLESMFTEDKFMGCPGATLDAALTNAAQSDYWYDYEKDYEWPSGNDDCEVEDELED